MIFRQGCTTVKKMATPIQEAKCIPQFNDTKSVIQCNSSIESYKIRLLNNPFMHGANCSVKLIICVEEKSSGRPSVSEDKVESARQSFVRIPQNQQDVHAMN